MATSLNTVIVDDQDSRINYSGQWSLSGSSAQYNRSLHAPGSEGAQMSFTFSGTSVAVVGNLEPGATCSATFSIDGNPMNYISPPTNATLTQQTIWTSPELPEGNHTLIYTAASCTPTSNTTATSEYKSSLSLDYLLYDTEEIPDAATIFIDDRDQRLRYSGTWSTDGGDGDFRLTRRGGGKGSSVQLAFTGSSVGVYGRMDNVSAAVQTSFTVDGEKLGLLNTGSQNSVTFNVEFFKNGSLTPGEHTLVINCLADGPFWLDYILLRSPPRDSTPKTGTPLGAVVGSVIGVLGLIGVGLVAWIFYFRKRRNSTKNNTLTSFPKQGLVRRFTRYDANTADPFSRDPTPAQSPALPPKQYNANMAPSVTSYQSTAGLLAAHTSEVQSVSDANSTRHRAHESVHTDYHNASQYGDDDDDSVSNLPPEYATTAPSGTNIGCIPSPPLPSNSSAMQYPPSRANTFSTMHRRHSSIPSDVGESEISSTTHSHYPPASSRAGSQYKPRGYTGDSRQSHTSHKSHGNARYVVNAEYDDDVHLSVAEMKRRQRDVVHHNPIVHTDSGVRLPVKTVDGTYPSTSTSISRTFPTIHDSQVPPLPNHRDDLRNVPGNSNDHSSPAYNQPEVADPPSRPVTSTPSVRALPGPSAPSLEEDPQSIAALKRQQHMLIFSPEGLGTQTIPVDDGYANLPPSVPGTARHRDQEVLPAMAQSEHGYTSVVRSHGPPQPDEVPPVYSYI